MIEFFKRILWDESAFERYGRALIVGLAMYGRSKGWIDDALASILVGGGLLIPAGQMNPKEKEAKK